MADEQRQMWEPDELQKVLAARHAEFDEQYKLLMARLEKPFPVFEPSAMIKQIDAHLKALQDLVRSLPPRNSISD
jgi:hypothetical protein